MKKLFCLLVIFSLCSCVSATAQKDQKTVIAETKKDFPYTQKGVTATFKGSTLTINRLHHTDFEGKEISNKEFSEKWPNKKAKANADLTFSFYNKTQGNATLELTNPRVGKHRAFSYRVKIISGSLPKIMDNVVLKIDEPKF